MATQSLYRRYRPRRFSELRGQEHIVRALRTSVAEGREGQSYLFSGPRGTGKTTTARIMAKVLNCQNPQDGEPCCECDSCLAVEKGTSYDVHELDAASNNGVDAMRDLIEKASLGTPGRHKVYILDEVHMLSKGAEAALLKTLEEPPPHVVFVLATTDPQKMSDTIISRTQHLQFHLLGADTLQEHVRWVAADAGLTVSDEAIEQVIAQGAGSPRDTLSALELVANSGGAVTEVIPLDEFAEAMIESDPGRALKMVAHAISRGRDPRTITEELIAYFRNGFLTLMAPELVQVTSQRLDDLTDVARRVGAAGLVRGIEQLGAALVEMRNAPDPRVLLDVATVQLTSEQVGGDLGALVARVVKLERLVAEGVPVGRAGAGGAVPVVAETPAPVDPSTGRRKLGSRAPEPSPTAGPAPAEPAPAAAVEPSTAEPAPAAPERAAAAPLADESASASPSSSSPSSSSPPSSVPQTSSPESSAPAVRPVEQVPSSAVSAPAGGAASVSAADWAAIRAGFKGMVRARLAPAEFVGSAPGELTISLPNEPHREKCEGLRGDVEAAVAAHAGAAVSVTMIVAGGSGGSDGPGAAPGGPSGTSSAPAPASAPASVPAPSDPRARVEPSAAVSETGAGERARNGRQIADQARQNGPEPDPEDLLVRLADSLPDDHEVDLDDLVDAPPESVKSPIDRLAEAFPGSELVDDQY